MLSSPVFGKIVQSGAGPIRSHCLYALKIGSRLGAFFYFEPSQKAKVCLAELQCEGTCEQTSSKMAGNGDRYRFDSVFYCLHHLYIVPDTHTVSLVKHSVGIVTAHDSLHVPRQKIRTPQPTCVRIQKYQ